MVKKSLSLAGPSNLAALLAQFREDRAGQPQFYYNELADRAASLAELRPALQAFLDNRLSLNDYVRQLSEQSRRQLSAARGRETGRYWRFNGAGRLFLESYFKLAGTASSQNAAAAALRDLLTVPANLDAAGLALENFTAFLDELNGLSPETFPLKPGNLPYVASYQWSALRPDWPVYQRVSREQLERLGRLVSTSTGPAGRYTNFYLAFIGLTAELNLTNLWEMDGFLAWLSRRELATVRLTKPRNSPEKPAQVRAQQRTEELRRMLEPALRTSLGSSLRGWVQTPASKINSEPGFLQFAEPGMPFSLELRPTETGNWLAGANFEGFSVAGLATGAGETVLRELQGFLVERPEYRLYRSGLSVVENPTVDDLGEEFWLLRSWPFGNAGLSLEDLVSEWRLLYPFARRLSAPFDDANPAEFLPENVNEPEPESLYPLAREELAAVAEPPEIYSVLPVAETAPEAGPPPPRLPDPEANAEVLRIARLKMPPLSSDQLEALQVFLQERLVVQTEKIAEIITHLEAGRSLLLYGPPGTGKTRLARLIAGQLGATDPGWAAEASATNYTLATATAEWSQYDTIGGIRPGLAGEGGRSQSLFYYYEPGVVSRAALCCEESLRRSGRPHYLIIDEFNRANQDRAFGELFTLLEYRDRPLLPAARLGRSADLFIPEAFRIIGTLNAVDRNTLFEMSQALRRRFAMVEIGLPPAEAERRFLPRALKSRLPYIELTPAGDLADLQLRQAADTLSRFVAAVRPDSAQPGTGGKAVGTAPLIESLLFCAVAPSYYKDPQEALEDAILANILPQLEGTTSAVKKALAAVAPGGPLAGLARVRASLEKLLHFPF